MKKFNIMRNILVGKCRKKGDGLGQFANLREGGLGLAKRRRVFLRWVGRMSDTPMDTMNMAITLTVILIY